MTEEERPPDRKRRRRAAAAFTDLRERLTGACGKFAKVEDWRAFLAQHFTPLLSEFGDVLPAGARGLLEGAADVAEPTQAGIAKACEMLRGGLKSVAEEMAAQTGIQARIQDAIQQTLRPVAGLVPDAIAKTTLGKALVALALAAVGAGSIAGVAAVVMSGDGGPAQPAVLGASASPTAMTSSTSSLPPGATLTPTAGSANGALPDPCSLITAEDARALFGEDVVQTSESSCDYRPVSAPTPADGCPVVSLSLWHTQEYRPDTSSETEPGLGDEAFWDSGNTLIVIKGDIAFSVSAWLKHAPQCGASEAEIRSWRDEWRSLAKVVLSRLGS